MDKIKVRLLGAADLAMLTGVAGGLFDHPVRPGQAAAFLADPGHMMVLALAGGEAVGFASGTVLLHPDKAPSFFVNEVGVRDGWRRRGIGRRLCEGLTAAARARGCQGVWLGTEPDNRAALALYRSLAGEERPFVGFGWDGAFDP